MDANGARVKFKVTRLIYVETRYHHQSRNTRREQVIERVKTYFDGYQSFNEKITRTSESCRPKPKGLQVESAYELVKGVADRVIAMRISYRAKRIFLQYVGYPAYHLTIHTNTIMYSYTSISHRTAAIVYLKCHVRTLDLKKLPE